MSLERQGQSDAAIRKFLICGMCMVLRIFYMKDNVKQNYLLKWTGYKLVSNTCGRF